MIVWVRGNLARGKPSVLGISKQINGVNFELSFRIGRPGDEEQKQKSGLYNTVSQLLFIRIKDDGGGEKGQPIKKSVKNPVIENLSLMEGNGPKFGPTMANLASIKSIL